jgi:hypothetical protein
MRSYGRGREMTAVRRRTSARCSTMATTRLVINRADRIGRPHRATSEEMGWFKQKPSRQHDPQYDNTLYPEEGRDSEP